MVLGLHSWSLLLRQSLDSIGSLCDFDPAASFSPWATEVTLLSLLRRPKSVVSGGAKSSWRKTNECYWTMDPKHNTVACFDGSLVGCFAIVLS